MFYLLTILVLSYAIDIQITSIPVENTPAIALKSPTMAVYGTSQLIIFGGKTDTETLHNELFSYDLSKNLWDKLRPVEYPWPGINYLVERYSLSCFTKGYDYCIYGGNSLRGSLLDIWCMNPTYLTWRLQTATGSTPSPRYMSGWTRFKYEGVNYMAMYGGFKRSDISSGIHL